ncbi:hypothetical protein PFFVO_06058, partial [Plasmodium falciparum Vietnam Oak-Knoll (FVO)]
MGPKEAVSAPKYYQATSAKDFLDQIGQIVHNKVDKEDADYRGKLHGSLKQATYSRNSNGQETPKDPCELQYEYHTNVTDGFGNEYPCKDRPDVRFSDTEGAQCDKSKIKDNKGKSEGACAPYRRSSLCDYHLSYMNAGKTNTTDNLLLEVCLAAKHEGASITRYHGKHQLTNKDSQLCTELARSFADIGDIVRGRDLYRGNSKEKKKREDLEKNLKEIFQKIQGKYPTLKDLPLDAVREYWWDANRKEVWTAITCKAGSDSQYFRATCSNGLSRASKQCRCVIGDVPTYFDYVPQYLRWFEEWAEDFCRKKKKYVNIVKKFCREGENGKIYCSGDGFDCTKTIRAIGIYAIGDECTKCSVACRPYKRWLENQKQEFLKQKKKCENEISGNGRQRQRRSTTSNYKGYEKQFYEELKTKGDLDKFLDLLNKEEVCTKITDTEGGTINFKTVNSGSASGDGNGSNKTFYHSDYCQPCPPCGVEKKSNGEFQEKPETKSGECDGKKPYTIKDKATSNDIEVLSFGDKGEDRETKLKKFCTQTNGDTINSGGSGTGGSGGGSNSEIKDLIEKWQCYEEQDIKKHGEHDLEYDRLVTGAGGLCILENKNKKESQSNPQNEPDQFQKTFNDFFYFWIGRFLNDSMYWRGKVNSCINNPKRKKCKNDCEKLCGCFQRWIKKKKDEWDKIVEHFNKQNMGENNLYGNFGHDVVLKTVLKLDELFNNIKSGYGNAKELEGINKMLEKEKKREKEEAADGTDNENNTTIDKLLQHEGDEAKGCLEKRKDPCPLPEDKSRGRSAETREDERTQQPADDTSHAASDDEDDEDGDEVEETETEAVETPPKKKDTTSLDVCDTVKTALTTPGNLTQACPTKYVNGREKFPNWKCVTPSDTKSVATGESSPSRAKRAASGDTTGKSDGSICVPPRRRKLYIGKIKEWAKKQAGDKGESKSQVNGDGDSESSDSANGDKQTQQQAEASNSTLATSAAASTETPESSQLRDAFVKSAAVETFFLWHRYKKEWEAQKAAEKAREGGLVPGVGGVPGVGALGVGGAGIPGGPGMAEGASLQPQQLPTLGPTVNGDPDDPEQQLKSGNIPPDFLRQMFYTLGDYRDICVGNTDIVSKASSEEHKKAMEKIKENIEKILPKNGGTSGVKPAPKSSVTTPQQTWWKDNAQHIWKGMICALTHKTETPGEVDNEVYNKFFGENNNKNPGTNTGTAATPNGTQNGTTGTTGTYESTYKYDIVKLKEEETSGPKSTTPTQTTHLSEFVLRPPYFRYLEEWGENFCKERMKRLKQIKKDCKVGQGNGKNGQRCSGFGEDCDDNLLDKKYDILPSFNCQSCGTPCAFYRKWIRRKKEEFIKQKNAYNEQKDKCQTQSNNNAKEFCAKLKETCTDAAAFLQKLGSCKKDSGKDKLNFKKPDDTFKDAEDCKPCSEFKIDCTKAKCSGTNGNNCKDNKITAEKIGNGVDSTVLDMLVSDNSGNGVEGVLDECAGANIFKGIRKEEWECGNVCGYEVCKPKIVEGQENGKNQIILITAF